MSRLFYIFALFLLVLQGCSAPSPSFSDMSQVYQSEVEKYQNNNLLLNIVRASKNMPLSFLDIPSVVGTGSLSETVGLGAFIYGGSPGSVAGFFSPTAPSAYMTSSYYNPSASISVGRSFNFTLSSLQNAQFEKGFLQKIPLETVNFFTNDQVSRELLFLLLIDRFEFISPDGKKNSVVNSPLMPGYDQFLKQLQKLVDGGLTTEMVTKQMKLGPPINPEQILDKNGLVNYVGLAEKNIVLQDVSGGKQKQFQLVQVTTQVRFCFAPTKYQTEVIEYFGEEMLCANPLGLGQSEKQAPRSANVQAKSTAKPIIISVRSPKDVFQFLGETMQAQTNKSQPDMVGLRKWVEKGNSGLELSNELAPLMVISSGSPKDRPVASIAYDGVDYYIPSQGSGYSVYVINLLSQLVNLIKIPGSIPASPAVLIK